MSETNKTTLSFTGERFIPGEGGSRIAYEHYHRYFFARHLATKKAVLDLGCGEGYGSHLLAGVAERVTGVDLSAEAVEHARSRYVGANLEYRVADCRTTGLPDQHFDLVVCFEMVEHIADHDRLLSEVRRVLKKNGVFVVSSPNKEFYSDLEGFENPFHVKELCLRDFQHLLRRNFAEVVMFSQSLCFGSVMWRILEDRSESALRSELIEVEGKRDRSSFHFEPVEGRTKYVVAVCSAQPLEAVTRSLMLSCLNDTGETALKELEKHNRDLTQMVDTLHGHLRNAGNMLIDKDNRIAQRDIAIQEKESHIAVLHQVIEGKDKVIVDKDAALQNLAQGLAEKDQAIQDRDQLIGGLQQGMQVLREFEWKVKSSWAWKMYRAFLRPIRLLFRRGAAS